MLPEDLDAVVDNELRAYEFPWTRGIFLDCLRAGHECRLLYSVSEASVRNDLPPTVLGHGILSLGAGEAHLLNVCVRRDQQGAGYGRLLVLHMLDRARERGAERVFLEVRPSNHVAGALYRSLGFQEIGVRRNYYPTHLGHEDARVLALDLPPQ